MTIGTNGLNGPLHREFPPEEARRVERIQAEYMLYLHSYVIISAFQPTKKKGYSEV